MKTFAVFLVVLLSGAPALAQEVTPSDVPRVEHLKAGQAATFEGDLLNVASQRGIEAQQNTLTKEATDAKKETAITKEELRIWQEQNPGGGVQVGTVVGIVVVVTVVAAAAAFIGGVVIGVQSASK